MDGGRPGTRSVTSHLAFRAEGLERLGAMAIEVHDRADGTTGRRRVPPHWQPSGTTAQGVTRHGNPSARRRRIGGTERSAALICQLLGKSSSVACVMGQRMIVAFETPRWLIGCRSLVCEVLSSGSVRPVAWLRAS